MAPIISQLRYYMRSSMLLTLIAINVGVFLLLKVAALVLFLMALPAPQHLACMWVELPSQLPVLATRPWTLITYMFAQFDLLHLLFNMLWLWWFGRIFLEISTGRHLTALYIYGGLGGAALFLLCYNLFPIFAGGGSLIGSSAAVLAIVTAAAMLMPDYPVNLLFIGQVKIKWIAIATIVIVVLSISGSNIGGEIAHIGGIVTGAIYALMRKRGTDITRPLNSAIDAIVNLFRGIGSPRTKRVKRPKKASKAKGTAASSTANATETAELDKILDKIKQSGYGGLTAEEKKKLFEISSRIK